MKTYKRCKYSFCFANSEYRLLDMDLCEYHFIKLNNDVFSKDGNERLSELARLLD